MAKTKERKNDQRNYLLLLVTNILNFTHIQFFFQNSNLSLNIIEKTFIKGMHHIKHENI